MSNICMSDRIAQIPGLACAGSIYRHFMHHQLTSRQFIIIFKGLVELELAR
jgi:hypothetical protein